tara:strand:- start:58608 stop:60944 length:2337 start_codon:yes stop_codon:yes gene_type:complete
MVMQNLIDVNGTKPFHALIGKQDYLFNLDANGQSELKINDSVENNSEIKTLSLNVPVEGPIDSNLLGVKKMFQDRWQTIGIDSDTLINGGVVTKPICSAYDLQIEIKCYSKQKTYINAPNSKPIKSFEREQKALERMHSRYLKTLSFLTTGMSQMPQTQDEMNIFSEENPEKAQKLGQLLGIDLNIQAKELTNTSKESMPMHVFWKIMPEAQAKFLQNSPIEHTVLQICRMLSEFMHEHPNVTIDSEWIRKNREKVQQKLTLERCLQTSESYCFDQTVDMNNRLKMNGVVIFESSKQADQQKPEGVTDKAQAWFLFKNNMDRIQNNEYLNADGSINAFVIGSMAACYDVVIGDCEDITYRKFLEYLKICKVSKSPHVDIDMSLQALKSKNNIPNKIDADLVSKFAQVASEFPITPTVGAARSAHLEQQTSVNQHDSHFEVPIKEVLNTIFEGFKEDKLGGHAYTIETNAAECLKIFIEHEGNTLATVTLLQTNPTTIEGTANKLGVQSKECIKKMDAVTNLCLSLQINKNLENVQQMQNLQQNLTRLNKNHIYHQDALNVLSSIQTQFLQQQGAKADSVMCATDSGSSNSFYFGNLISQQGIWLSIDEDWMDNANRIQDNEWHMPAETFRELFEKGKIGYACINENKKAFKGILTVHESDLQPDEVAAIQKFACFWNSMCCPETVMQDLREKTLLVLQKHASKKGISRKQREEIAAAYGDPNSNVNMNKRGLTEKDLTEYVATVCFGGPAVQDLLQKQNFEIKEVNGAKFIALNKIRN